MKIVTKDDKAITLIALIITIIIMLILTGITVYTGFNTLNNARVTKFVAEMQLIQTKIDELSSSEIRNIGEEIENTDENAINVINSTYSNGEISTNDYTKFKKLSVEELKEEFDIDDLTDSIIINYETREVLSVAGIDYKGEKYYTQYKLPNGQILQNNLNLTAARTKDFDIDIQIDGLNADITISNISIDNATLSYKEENDVSWKVITNYTEENKQYRIVITKSGNYIFKIHDNVDNLERTYSENIILTNKPKTNMEVGEYNYSKTSVNWAYIQEEQGDIYVWIPRFVYKLRENEEENDENDDNKYYIKFIKGNSSITTDSTYADDSWILPSEFSAEDTGIWVKIEEIQKNNLQIVKLLKDEDIILKKEIIEEE